MQIRFSREHADNPLLQRVSDPFSSITKCLLLRWIDLFPLCVQIRELADEEMLQDLDVYFE
jgi:hypothetical protein